MFSWPTSVAEAAYQLDNVKPGWFKLVNLAALSMGSLKDCLLGQVFGDYGDGLFALYGRHYAVDLLGVNWEMLHNPATHPFNYSENVPAWEAEIAERVGNEMVQITINVTRRDIKAAHADNRVVNADDCFIARAIKRRVKGCMVSVGVHRASTANNDSSGWDENIFTDETRKKYMRAFENDNAPGFKFPMMIPQKRLR